jgi:hypothetical protein
MTVDLLRRSAVADLTGVLRVVSSDGTGRYRAIFVPNG